MGELPAGHFQFSDLGQEADFLFTALQDDRFTEHAAWLAIIIGLWASVEEQFWFMYGALFN